jgi:hypothetical protein
MPDTPAGPHAEHDCCASGWTTAPPACCMDGRADEVPAIRMAKQVSTVSIIPTALLHDQDSLRLQAQQATGRSPFHSPPIPVVLRV